MAKAIDTPANVWSATPTPFNKSMNVCKRSVKRLVEHHVKLGVTGLFLLGTCGEGAWMTDEQRRDMVDAVVKHNEGRLKLAVQCTDNSAARIVDNMEWAKAAGADIAVIAPPHFLMNATPKTIHELYQEAIAGSPLPVGIYARGHHGPVAVPESVKKKLYMEEKVVLVKDSSSDPQRRDIALAARRKRPELLLLDGNEFMCVEYLTAGYDGLLLGGGIFNGYLAGQIMNAVSAGDIGLAEKLQVRMSKMMWDVYGGKTIACWLSGQKKLLVEMGIFSTWNSYLKFPLRKSCEKGIARVLKQEAEMLFPWREAS